MKEKIIFFGNGPLSEYVLEVLAQNFKVIFHARKKEDLEKAVELKKLHKEAHGILASFGVIIKPEILKIFEPEGILNIHPSLLPKYRGASPIESAILNGDKNFSVSIMKLVKEMDAGPIYHQETLENLPLNKTAIYKALSKSGADWLVKNLSNLPTPFPQDDKKATFTIKFEKKDSLIDPKKETADEILRKIVAFSGFPKVKYEIFGVNCTILKAHKLTKNENSNLFIPCLNNEKIAIDELQPDGKKPMNAKAFLNGYAK